MLFRAANVAIILCIGLGYSTEGAAQFLKEAQTIKLGVGCLAPLKKFSEGGLGVCVISEVRSRVWCPNGKVYERDGPMPDASLVYSVCGLNQRL
jgi:hypothetical protein